MWAIELFRSATFRLAILFALAVSVSAVIIFAFIYWQVATFDIKRLDVILVEGVARAVAQPADRLKRELELRFSSDLRRLDYAALFDQSGTLQYGNVVAILKGLPIDGKSHIIETRKLHGIDAGTEPVVFVAGQRQNGGGVLLGRSLYEVNALRQVVFQALMIGVVPAVLLALATGTYSACAAPAGSRRSTRQLFVSCRAIFRKDCRRTAGWMISTMWQARQSHA
jgi:hypothetical protein